MKTGISILLTQLKNKEVTVRSHSFIAHGELFHVDKPLGIIGIKRPDGRAVILDIATITAIEAENIEELLI